MNAAEYGKTRTHLLFVYGTMKSGFRNHARLGDSVFVGEFDTEDRFVMKTKITKSGELAPVLLLHPGRHIIRGELYLVDGPTLEVIDRAECHPMVYRRQNVWVRNYPALAQVYAFGYYRPDDLYTNGMQTLDNGSVSFTG